MTKIFPYRPALLKNGGVSLLAALAMTATAAAQSQSQSFDQVAPKQPEKTTQGKVVDQSATKPLTAKADTEVLVDQLKGVILLSDP